MADTATVDLPDVDPLPGKAQSWAKGEPVPKDMPSADDGRSPAPAAGKVTAQLADLQRGKIADSDKLYGGMDRSIEQAAELARAAYAQTGASLHDPALKPWNEEEQQKKFQTDPIQAFGSIGSVFGILASSFTHAPLTNSLNASAAAINAIKQGDRQGFLDARKAWEDNYKLALKRHEMQHEQYTDAITLMKTNMAAGEAKLRILAAKYGDKQTLMLLEAGLSPEVLQLTAARQKLYDDASLNYVKVEQANGEKAFMMEAKEKYLKEGMTKQQASAKAWQDLGEEQARLKKMGSPWGVGASNLTIDRQIAAATATHKEEMKAKHPDWSEDKLTEDAATYYRGLKQQATPITANRADEIRGKIGQVDQAATLIGHIEDMLKKHNAITGLGGKITRPMEIVSNIFGGNETDRVQFERWVEELQMIAPRILLDSRGRPLSHEAGETYKIIAGLRMGDTLANTSRAYYEFNKALDDIKGRLHGRIDNKVDDSGQAPAAPKPEGDWWKSSPMVH